MADRGSGRNGPAADFTLGEWFVQPSLNRISRGDEVTRLRPQLMDLLVCLAERAGQTVNRDEILSTVWPGQFIADTGLARCVAELRQALGDTAGQDAKYIQTIAKRGYRLIAAVAPVAVAPVAEGAAVPAVDVVSEVPAETPSAQSVTAAGETAGEAAGQPAGRRRPTSRRLALYIALIAVVVVAGIGALLVWRNNRPVPGEQHDTVLVVFENTTGDPLFDGALRLALTSQVEQSPYLRVVAEERVQEALRFMNRRADQPITRAVALDACQRVGAKAVLVGSLSPVGRNYAVGVEGVACQSQEVIAREQTEVTGKEQILGALGRIVSAVRQRLGESVASIRKYDIPIAQATTASLDALKAFSQGDYARAQGRDEDALRSYRRAIELDPSFALAHLRLGLQLLNLGRLGEGLDELKRAYAVRNHASEGERLYITSFYYTNVLRDPIKGTEVLETWRDSYPRNAVARFTLASVYGRIGRFDDGLREVEEALRLEPGNALASGIKMELLAHLGRIDEASRLGAEQIAKGYDSFVLHSELVRFAFQAGDEQGVRREVEWAAKSTDTANAFMELQAAFATFGGRIKYASSLLAGRVAIAKAAGDDVGAAIIAVDEATDRALVGQTTEPDSVITTILAKNRTPDMTIKSALAVAWMGDFNRAETLLREYERMPDVVQTSDPEVRPAVIALITMGRGFPQSAIEVLAQVRPYERGWRFNYLPAYIRGLAEMKLQHYDRAIAEFEPIAKQPGAVPDSLVYALAWLQLGRARTAAHDLHGGRAAYEQFLKYWKDADPDLPLAMQARAESARLGTS